ncbi:MAG: SEC-C metal-binding domain-containing protein, partial [Muribaculaceae bacterium]|nr:SEC-C metal-binding domain-containing protein [Muribaculaceae bacterium]
VTKAIENAQKRVEENNFGIRKRLLEYDDVMNKQRTYIYARRHHALLGERIGIDIANMFYDVIENLVNNYERPEDFAELSLELFKLLTIEAPFTESEYRNLSKEDKINAIHTAALEAFDRKSKRIIEVAEPVIKDCVENRGINSQIIVPITDGKRLFHLRVDIMEAYNSQSRNIVKEWHKSILLVSIDELWKEHLRELDQLRQSVQNASYEQKDPLVIYKVESFHLFERMLNNLNVKVVSALMRGQIYVQQRPAEPQNTAEEAQAQAQPRQDSPMPKVERAMPERKTDYSQYRASKEALPGEAETRRAASAPQGERQRPMPIVKNGPRVGRNDPCPCGSGKKFKNCHGRGL